MDKLAEMDLKKAISTFTKVLLWKLSNEGGDYSEELEALNYLRSQAGMGPISIPAGAAAPKSEPQAERPRQTPPPRSEAPRGGGTGMVVHVPQDARLLPDGKAWKNRFQIKSESSGRLYTIAQSKGNGHWGCDCPGWISRRNCKHLRALGLPGDEVPFEATLKQGSKTAAELMHSDNDLPMKMEPAVPLVPGPEAGPSNDEMHENQHEENGVPVTDGGIKSPERANVNAIREALETQVEMEVGKPISQKQDEVAMKEQVQDAAMAKGVEPGQAGATEVTAKPGTQIIINVASEKKAAERCTCQSDKCGHKPGTCDKPSAGPAGIIMCKDCLDAHQNFLSERYKHSTEDEGPDAQAVRDARVNEYLAGVAARGFVPVPETVERLKRGTTLEAEGIGGEHQPGATAGHAGGMFGGTDLVAPSFHVGFTLKGYVREASFSSLAEAQKFIKGASEKFGKLAGNWTMKCPWCGQTADKENPTDNYKCRNCNWDSTKGEDQKGKKASDPFSVDPARRQLVIELLKKGKGMTSDEIRRALGDSKHDMNHSIILQQLAKEGLVKHKQMRWYMKTAEVNPRGTETLQAFILDEYGDTEAATNASTVQEISQFYHEHGVDDMENIQSEDKGHKVVYTYTRQLTTASMRTATIQVKIAMDVFDKHELRIAIDTLKAPDAMVGVMGGPNKEQALATLAKHGLRWDDQDYMAGGKGVKQAGEGMAKTEQELGKEAGFNFFFPGQVLKEFYPELQHEIVDYPNASNSPMGGAGNPEITGDGGHDLEGMLDSALDTTVVEMIQLPGDVGEVEPMQMMSADYSSTSPAGGMGIGRDGKPEVLEGVPLRKENDIRGPMFTDEFYGQYQGVPGAALAVASVKTAAGDESKQFNLFLKKVCGEIAATMVAAFKVTARPLLDKVPGTGEIQLDQIEQGSASMPLGVSQQGGRVKYILSKLNDSDIKEAINGAWAQAAVWNDSQEGGFVYEVFVRPETIDTDSMKMQYKFVCGTRE